MDNVIQALDKQIADLEKELATLGQEESEVKAEIESMIGENRTPAQSRKKKGSAAKKGQPGTQTKAKNVEATSLAMAEDEEAPSQGPSGSVCEKGHPMDEGQKFCPKCGSPSATPDETCGSSELDFEDLFAGQNIQAGEGDDGDGLDDGEDLWSSVIEVAAPFDASP